MMNPKIEQILKEGEICRQNLMMRGIPGPTGPTGPIGLTGPTGPTGPSFNASLYGNVTATQTVTPDTNILFDNTPVINNVTYAGGNITLQESGLYFIDIDAYVRTIAGQIITLEVRKTTPTEEVILPLSSGTYVNSGSAVDMHGNALFYGEAGDVINIVNTSGDTITIESTGQNALNLSLFKVAEL